MIEDQLAEKHLLREMQAAIYSDVLRCVGENGQLPRGHSLANLATIIDSDGTLRVGVRLRSDLPEFVKHPYILHREHLITLLNSLLCFEWPSGSPYYS